MQNSEMEVRLLVFVAGFSDRLPATDIENASELISRREWGVGLELLCAQLSEYEVRLSPAELIELRGFSGEMGLDVSGFGFS